MATVPSWSVSPGPAWSRVSPTPRRSLPAAFAPPLRPVVTPPGTRPRLPSSSTASLARPSASRAPSSATTGRPSTRRRPFCAPLRTWLSTPPRRSSFSKSRRRACSPSAGLSKSTSLSTRRCTSSARTCSSATAPCRGHATSRARSWRTTTSAPSSPASSISCTRLRRRATSSASPPRPATTRLHPTSLRWLRSTRKPTWLRTTT
mmetsp:Transcript_45929/g.70294  ORF Transcript_45929/g.70294 Transcript_45929/m.70294 type:complete len:205 (+) Transcript_45929:275-889(+)